MQDMSDTATPYSLFVYAIKSPHTRKKYIDRLKHFFKVIGLDGMLVEEQALEFMRRAKTDIAWGETCILRFLQLLKDQVDRKQMAASTIWTYVAPIKLFCEMNQIEIPWKRLVRGLPRGKKWARDRAPTVEEIIQLCKYPDRRMKAIVYTTASGGFRLGAWDYLRWGDIQYLEDKDVAKVRIYAEEVEEYFTYISGEAYKELKEWMDFRAMSGERVTKDSWLMRQLWDVHTGCTPEQPKKLELDGMKTLIHDALKAQGLRTTLQAGKHRHEFKAIHGLRKFFRTRAEEAGVKSIHIKMLMGHSTGLDDSYYRPSESDLLEDYLKAVPLLTIESLKLKASEDKRIKELEEKNKELEEKNQAMFDSLWERILALEGKETKKTAN
jgi:hypothetical protein